MYHFKDFDMMNLQYEIKIWKKMLNKTTNDKKLHPPPPFEHTAPLPYTLWLIDARMSVSEQLQPV